MEIGLIYRKKDPKQSKARDFVWSYIQERGILANILETDAEVNSVTVIIDGQSLRERRQLPRGKKQPLYPDATDIARAIDQCAWSL